MTDETTLILRLRKGEEEAFELVFRQHFRKLCLYAEHYVKDKAAAEEIVEDFFCYFWDNCKDLIIVSSITGYLFTSTHNRCLKYLRHEKVKQHYIESRQYLFTDNEYLEPVSDDIPEAYLISQDLETAIGKAILSLPEQCRNIFLLNRFEDKTYLEISGHLGISINTVKTQITRAIRKLKLNLKDYLPEMIPFLIIVKTLVFPSF
jgi:RNA polymerase sigma-70 factor, ECF subfamily